MMLPAVTSPSVFTGDHGNVGFHWMLQIVDPKIKIKKKTKNKQNRWSNGHLYTLYWFSGFILNWLCCWVLALLFRLSPDAGDALQSSVSAVTDRYCSACWQGGFIKAPSYGPLDPPTGQRPQDPRRVADVAVNLEQIPEVCPPPPGQNVCSCEQLSEWRMKWSPEGRKLQTTTESFYYCHLLSFKRTVKGGAAQVCNMHQACGCSPADFWCWGCRGLLLRAPLCGCDWTAEPPLLTWSAPASCHFLNAFKTESMGTWSHVAVFLLLSPAFWESFIFIFRVLLRGTQDCWLLGWGERSLFIYEA